MSKEHSFTSFFLLRGLGREVRHWGDFCTQLESTHRNIRVIPLEIPGVGKRKSEKSPITVTGYVEELRDLYLDCVQPNHTNIILGLSFGAMIAARWTHSFAKDFHGAILINTSARPSSFYKRLRPSAAAKLLEAAFHRNSLFREKKIARLICNIAEPEVLGKRWGHIADSAPIATSNVLRQLYAAARFTMAPITTVPTLILCSTKDRLVNVACSHSIAQSWGITPAIHPTAGHDLTTDDAAWCINTIISWLANVHS
jgi:pimeloyl-ACP methyl ester carboxylesterase